MVRLLVRYTFDVKRSRDNILTGGSINSRERYFRFAWKRCEVRNQRTVKIYLSVELIRLSFSLFLNYSTISSPDPRQERSHTRTMLRILFYTHALAYLATYIVNFVLFPAATSVLSSSAVFHGFVGLSSREKRAFGILIQRF